MIPKIENTCKHKYNQSNVIKAIQSSLWPEQFGQSDESNIVSDMFRINPGVVTLSVALMQRPKT